MRARCTGMVHVREVRRPNDEIARRKPRLAIEHFLMDTAVEKEHQPGVGVPVQHLTLMRRIDAKSGRARPRPSDFPQEAAGIGCHKTSLNAAPATASTDPAADNKLILLKSQNGVKIAIVLFHRFARECRAMRSLTSE